jgi:hypothetical protein
MIYQVVRRGSKWHVHIPDTSAGVHPSEDKASIVAWACDAARRVDGEVQVRDRAGEIEVVYAYVDGVQQRKPGPVAARAER